MFMWKPKVNISYLLLDFFNCILHNMSFLPPRRFQGLNSKLSGLAAVPLPCWSDCSFIVYMFVYVYVLRDQRTTCKSYTNGFQGLSSSHIGKSLYLRNYLASCSLIFERGSLSEPRLASQQAPAALCALPQGWHYRCTFSCHT